MPDRIKIAIVGDFNFSYNAHHATNLSLEHSQNLLDIEISYYWIRINEASSMKLNQWKNYDAVWIAPGPFENVFFLSNVLQTVLESGIPTLITGDAFKVLIEILIANYNLNPNKEKLISDNLVSGESFHNVEVYPVSKELKKLYHDAGRIELSSSRYSLYPQLINYLKDDVMDIEAINEFEEPEIISLKTHDFCVATMFCPQICSTREMPNPIITAFLNYIFQSNSVNI